MVDASKNDTRLTARIPHHVRETLQKAAELSGATLNQFVVQAAIKEAHRVLEDDRVIVLSERDADTVFGLIENPPAPNARLKAAVERHEGFFRESN